MEANLEIAMTCLRYLSLQIFDIELDEDEISESILSGSYRLHWFATTQWIEVVRRYSILLCNQSPPATLITALNAFSEECENGTTDATADLESLKSDDFEVFKNAEPAIHKLLHQALQFCRMDVGKWKLEDDDEGKLMYDLFRNAMTTLLTWIYRFFR
jgi:hypothetical protein